MATYNLTTANNTQIADHIIKAVRSQSKQQGSLHADLRHLVANKATKTIEGIVSVFAKELESDIKAAKAHNQKLRASISTEHAKAGLSGDELQAAIKKDFDSHPDKMTADRTNWDNCRKAVQRAYGKDIKTTITTKGDVKTEKAKPPTPKVADTDTVSLFDRIAADFAALLESNPESAYQVSTSILNAVNAHKDSMKLAKAA